MLVLFNLVVSNIQGQSTRNVQLLDHWTTDSISAIPSNPVRFSEVWGFTEAGEEYAVIGGTNGTFVFHIKNDKLIYSDFILGKSHSPVNEHRDYHDYRGHLYMVSDEGPSSLQIADLQYLPDSLHIVYDSDDLIIRTHNIFIDTNSAILYSCGPSSGYAMELYSLADPALPTLIYSYDDIPYVHDIYVENDTAYLNCGDSGLKIIDFSTPNSPFEIATLEFYQDQGYNHSGWLSPDGKTYIFTDETEGKRLKKCDVSDLPNIQIESFFGSNYQTGQVAHNVMMTKRFAVVSYYNEGLRIYDYTEDHPVEVAHYDTWSGDQETYKFNGAWGIYIFHPSKNIIVSDRQSGLYLFRFDYDFPILETGEKVSVYPNPSKNNNTLTFYIDDYDALEYQYEIINVRGQVVFSETSKFNYLKTQLNIRSGIYQYRVRFYNKFNEEQVYLGKISIIQ